MAQFFRRRWPGVSYGRGEDWHYVGGAGEPAFENDWVNASGWPATAFRFREAGIVDVHFGGADGTAQTVFTLPEGYRPSAMTPVAGLVVAYTALSPLTAATAPTVQIDTDGTVILSAVETVVLGGAVGFFFLDPPTATP